MGDVSIITQYPEASQELFDAILSQAPNEEIAAALLVGSYGESGWDPYAAGSGGAGAFGFTPPSFPLSDGSLPPAQQVAIILPSYLNIPYPLPASVTNPAARAEWIAIAAERPLYDTNCLATIQATNAPTTYGANTSYTVQNWGTIEAILATKYSDPPAVGDIMFINYLNQTWQFVSNGLNSFWRKCPNPSPTYPVLDDPDGTWFALWDHEENGKLVKP